jgi:single-stranded-DNA-specific exonuclease
MICLDGDHGKGSCRSFGGFNLFEALSACAHTLESYGGHALAAGLNIKRENIPAFRKAIKAYYDAHPPCREKVLQIDLRIGDGRMMDFGSIEDLELLEPCGSGNPRPTCCVTDAVLESVIPTGGGKHLRLRIRKFDRSFSCIYFTQTEEGLGAQAGDFVDVAFSPQINEYRGHRNVQLVIEDLCRADVMPLCRALLRGELPAGAEKALIEPVRADFVALWNRVKHMGGTVSGDLEPTLRMLAGDRHPGLASCCLAVFAQMGLAELRVQDDALELRLNLSGGAKADLESAPLLQKLRRS